MSPDMINGMFELTGAFLVGNHCRAVMRDRSVKGVSIMSTAIFTLWGLWNIFFYSNLSLPYSFTGSILLMLVNAIYVSLMIYYRYKETNIAGEIL
jgi:hypothetical protein